MFVAALFTIAKTWNQPKHLSSIDRIKKLWHIHTMEYYAAIKNDEFMSFIGTWMNLETILSKLTQEQKTKHYVVIHRWLLNKENMWTQGGEHHTLWSVVGGARGGIMRGEIPVIGDGGMKTANDSAMCAHMQQSCMFFTCTPKPKMQ